MISMSGFGQASGEVSGMRVEVVIRSVNARGLELRVFAPDELGETQLEVEVEARRRLARGKVDLRLRLERAAGATAFQPDRARVRAAVEALRALTVELGHAEAPRLEHLLALKDELLAGGARPGEGLDPAALKALVAEALDKHQAHARREGEALLAQVRAAAAGIRGQVARYQALLRDGASRRREALKARISEALEGRGALDPTRLEQEVALIVDRADVSEELARLHSHLAELDALLAAPHEVPKGRKLDYLCVEIHRELSTSAAKNALAEGAAPLIEARLLNEQIREQAANVV
jgi:uncharacterized protein (TIGR00255 family)